MEKNVLVRARRRASALTEWNNVICVFHWETYNHIFFLDIISWMLNGVDWYYFDEGGIKSKSWEVGIRCASEIKFSGKIVADEVDQWILGKEIELWEVEKFLLFGTQNSNSRIRIIINFILTSINLHRFPRCKFIID